MKKVLIYVLLLASSFGFSQVKFESGYFIDNENNRINCLIKNYEWKNNPSKISYRLSNDSQIKELSVEDIKEFAIGNSLRYVRAEVAIDLSRNEVTKLSAVSEPEFEKKILFLKQIIDGKASLYSYNAPGLNRYFFSTDNTTIEQLVYKQYLNYDGKIEVNSSFRNQIWDTLKCIGLKINDLNNLNYNLRALTKYFKNYNLCVNSDATIYKKERGTVFTSTLSIGVNNGTMELIKGLGANNDDLGNNSSIKVGAELEYFLPFNKSTWSFYVNPSYLSYKGEGSFGTFTSSTVNAKFNFLDLGAGVRHYIFVTDNSKLKLDLSYIQSFALKTDILYVMNLSVDPTLTDVSIDSSLNIGIGYVLDKLRFDFNYTASRKIKGYKHIPLTYLLDWESEYQNLSLSVGYRIF